MAEQHTAPGPFETASEAAAAVAHILASPGASWTDGFHRLLEDACRAAGVELGAFDHSALVALAGEATAATLASLAGIIARAAEPSLSAREALMGPAGVAQPGGGMVSGPSNWPTS